VALNVYEYTLQEKDEVTAEARRFLEELEECGWTIRKNGWT
jgi:hypothetical protein